MNVCEPPKAVSVGTFGVVFALFDIRATLVTNARYTDQSDMTNKEAKTIKISTGFYVCHAKKSRKTRSEIIFNCEHLNWSILIVIKKNGI